MNVQAIRIPPLVAQVGKYALGLLAIALLYKIYQVYTAKRWSDTEISRRILEGFSVEEWRRATCTRSTALTPSGPAFEDANVSFEPVNNGAFKVGTRTSTDEKFREAIYTTVDPKDPITAAVYKAGQIFIARRKNIGRFDLKERLEVRNWLQADHDIMDLSFDKGVLFARGTNQETSWDFGLQREPDIIDRLVLKFFS